MEEIAVERGGQFLILQTSSAPFVFVLFCGDAFLDGATTLTSALTV